METKANILSTRIYLIVILIYISCNIPKLNAQESILDRLDNLEAGPRIIQIWRKYDKTEKNNDLSWIDEIEINLTVNNTKTVIFHYQISYKTVSSGENFMSRRLIYESKNATRNVIPSSRSIGGNILEGSNLSLGAYVTNNSLVGIKLSKGDNKIILQQKNIGNFSGQEKLPEDQTNYNHYENNDWINMSINIIAWCRELEIKILNNPGDFKIVEIDSINLTEIN